MGRAFGTETISMVGVWRWVAALGVVAVVGGCSTGDRGPTVEQAGRTLQEHITELMESVGAEELVVTDPGGRDVACGVDGVKRTYGVRSTFNRFDDNLIAEMAGRLGTMWGYEVHDPYKPGRPKTTLRLVSSRTSITVETPSDHEAVASGETDCIPRG
ncbi:hypothetical protein [Nonomuraea rubra]|uniref:Uncharacterized protein n=1 Tax=Nonomuraea rubra TaxID=46180 RepID=A0A7X0U065_9ACTN|nr:hypothetical protein [Nonomuraea rubra]MBB6549990.1 hypothetical protein [Nonomuraea rubra]